MALLSNRWLPNGDYLAPGDYVMPGNSAQTREFARRQDAFDAAFARGETPTHSSNGMLYQPQSQGGVYDSRYNPDGSPRVQAPAPAPAPAPAATGATPTAAPTPTPAPAATGTTAAPVPAGTTTGGLLGTSTTALTGGTTAAAPTATAAGGTKATTATTPAAGTTTTTPAATAATTTTTPAATATPQNDFTKSMQSFMESMQSMFGPPPKAPTMDEQFAMANAAASAAYRPPELTPDQLNRMSASWQAQQLMNADSPLLAQARDRAMQTANARGLLNSSMGVEAGTQAMLAEAGNFGRADASTYGSMLQSDRDAAARSRDVFAQAAFADARSQREAEQSYRNTMVQAAASNYNALMGHQFNLQRDASQNAFQMQRDATQNTFARENQATQNAFQLERDKNNNTFQLERDKAQQNDALKIAQMQIDAQKALSAQGYTQQQGLLSAQQTGQLGLQAAAQQGQLANSLALGQQNLSNQLATDAARAQQNLAAQTALTEQQNRINTENAATTRRNNLWASYQSTIGNINTKLTNDIAAIQTSSLPANVKSAQIRTLQTLAQNAINYQNSLFTANQDWQSSWVTFKADMSEVAVAADPVDTKAGTQTAGAQTAGTQTAGAQQLGGAGATGAGGSQGPSAAAVTSGMSMPQFIEEITKAGWWGPNGIINPGTNARNIYEAAKLAGIKGADAAAINAWAATVGLPPL